MATCRTCRHALPDERFHHYASGARYQDCKNCRRTISAARLRRRAEHTGYPYRIGCWADRWEKRTGIRPDVTAIRGALE